MSIRRRPWDGIVSAQDIEVHEKAGFGGKGGLGTRPAISIIDVQYRTAGLKSEPILESMKTYPSACGEYAWRAIGNIERLLAAARPLKVPIIYVYVAPKKDYDAGRLGAKMPTLMTIDEKGYEFPTEIAPQPGDIMVPKRHPSAFFGTSMASYLVDMDIDTLIVTGATTTGCVRATVVDAFSYNFKVAVAEDAVYDRVQVGHAVSLYDMASKFADVMLVDEIIEYLQQLNS